MQPHDGPGRVDDVSSAFARERMPDAEARTSLVVGDAAHGPSVSSPAHGIATGPADLTQT